MPTLFSFALRNIKRKPLRTGILVFAVALLVSSLVFAISFLARVNGSLRKSAERLGADLLVVPANARGAAEDVLLENKIRSFYMDRRIMDRVRAVEGVDRITEQIYLVTMSTMCCSVPEAMVVAFDQDSDFIVKPWLAQKLSGPLGTGEAVAGDESAFNIRLGLVEVDSKLFGSVFRIVAALDRTGTALDNAVFITTDNMERIIASGAAKVRPGDISAIFVRVKPGADPSAVAARIEDSVIEVDVIARKDIGRSLLATLKDMGRIFTLAAALASIMVFFLVWAVFTAIANERGREVGIMRALGARESHILRIFLLEVLIIGSIGSVLGILGGSGLSAVLSGAFSVVNHLSTDLAALERAIIAAAGFLGGTIICVLGAFGPILRLKRLEPLLIIKTE